MPRLTWNMIGLAAVIAAGAQLATMGATSALVLPVSGQPAVSEAGQFDGRLLQVKQKKKKFTNINTEKRPANINTAKRPTNTNPRTIATVVATTDTVIRIAATATVITMAATGTPRRGGVVRAW